MCRRFAVLLQGVLVSVVLHAQPPAQFSTTVRAGEKYVHPIGHGLYFVLQQIDGGDWNFQISPSRDSEENYTKCLGSPVMHGPGTVDLTAWRFAHGADMGWAETLPVTKQVAFVTDAADQKYECAESSAIYDSFQRSQSAGLTPDYSGLAHYRQRPRGHVRVTIPAVSLKPGLSGKDSEFSSVTLYVSVNFPKDKRAGGR